jgi:Tol biopolymer transport system component
VRTKFINGGVDRPIPTHPDIPNANAPRWFQSDRYLIFTSTSGLWMLDLMNSSYRKLYHGYTYSYSLSADGVWLATLEMTFNPLHHTIHLVNTYTGESIVLGDGSNPFFINNDTEILTDEPTGVFVTDLNGNQRKLFTKGNPDAVRVSPNGRHVAHATPDGIAIIDIASGNTIRTIPIRHSDFTPSTLGKWDRMDIRFRSMHFSDDGSKLYFTVQRDFEKDGGC